MPPVEYQRASLQADGLYRAGGAAVGAGLLLGAVAGWQVFRQREESDDEEED